MTTKKQGASRRGEFAPPVLTGKNAMLQMRVPYDEAVKRINACPADWFFYLAVTFDFSLDAAGKDPVQLHRQIPMTRWALLKALAKLVVQYDRDRGLLVLLDYRRSGLFVGGVS